MLELRRGLAGASGSARLRLAPPGRGGPTEIVAGEGQTRFCNNLAEKGRPGGAPEQQPDEDSSQFSCRHKNSFIF